ncbi:MAG: ABC transporter ATP-binding protein [Coprococcus sp.]
MVRTLAGSIRQYKKQTILSPITVSFEVIFEIIIPLLMARLIDEGIDMGNMAVIWKYGMLLLAVALLSLLSGTLSGRFAAQASAGFAKNLRQDMYYKVQDFSFANIDKFSTASLVTRMTTDVTNVQMAFQMIIRVAVRSPIMLIAALIAAISIDARLSLIYLIAVPILGIGLYVIITRTHPIFEKVFKIYDRLNAIVQENLYGIRVVKSFTREDHEIEKFNNVSNDIYKNFVKAEQQLAFNMPLMQLAVYTCMLMICWFGARAIVACGGDSALGLSTGEFMSLFTYTMQILMSLMMLSMIFVMTIMARASAERICEVLAEESNLTNPEKPVYEVKNGNVVFEDVEFSYNKKSDKPVLNHVNLNIRSGQTIGILGGTGSSKSSLVQLIPRLYDVTAGRILVGDVDVRNYDIESLRDAVAMVLQKNVLFSGTIKDNLRWGDKNATDEDIERVCRLACADEFIRTFPDGYDTYIEQGGTNVSGGQKQRLCIARALLKKPKILILDDSTSAVDTKTDASIRKAFAEEIPDTTKIIIAQRVASVQDADQIVVLDDGEISAVGTHEELVVSSHIYREVYESQMKGGEDNE